ncbi:TetR/AcrR family transcriptional regulator [Pseudomonas tolaasii]|uniref:TetR/AcrR family transcriptional regulator n=2 Tax=Pseudomonas tolaasii TaxID=29442 RepID=A0A7Y8DQ25_PSETO|nr:TetR/AcrR family transcriptional regulator [Pseudomonas tolaasii]ARB30020.1 TetR family transcriptional regulator [Pseudomonas tolaasii]KAB0466121.1 TetR/AcrR family transcriptional regulator [Pseudomonas tolaasii]MBW1250508.1 TetR/AcrR family transcriptional regulator [Pseudomonas tolaasii]MBW4793948.1 TetR/AcrR family transcriptional regulator [Pseudomonas tolaasii]MBY8939276.1 TetR/AcrR family transcriptional regulator [Pseudomonas tolaasii]
MPRVSRKQAELNREIIVEAATHLFRERGLHGISLSDVMAAAGLTHGGFYGHFASKEALATEACNKAFEQSNLGWQEKINRSADQQAAREAILRPYFSASHRDNPGDGCPISAFTPDMCHEPADTALQHAFIDGVEVSLDIFAHLHDDDRQALLARYAMMIGALTLARATRGNALSDEFLAAARNTLLAERELTEGVDSKTPVPA